MSNSNVSIENTAVKEKRGWFHSLTRRKKSSQQIIVIEEVGAPSYNINNNNHQTSANDTASGSEQNDHTDRRRFEESFLQRIRKKIGNGLQFRSLRRRSRGESDGANGTTDASEEFLTQTSPLQPEQHLLSFRFTNEHATLPENEEEIVPFTHDYKRFIAKKWRTDTDDENNRVMFKACSEMLNQVWYWGEISRKDAQKQLTDKPTGSFLVRDSETNGFTLSFRIVNVTLHYRLEYRNNYWRFEELQYESIVEMIEDILYRCTNDSFLCFVKVPNEMQPPFPVILKYPLSRYSKMPQLQDLCRRSIQRCSTTEEIAQMPIPTQLLEYLMEKRELVFAY